MMMDVKNGAVWGTVYCPLAAYGKSACRAADTFRFENCQQK